MPGAHRAKRATSPARGRPASGPLFIRPASGPLFTRPASGPLFAGPASGLLPPAEPARARTLLAGDACAAGEGSLSAPCRACQVREGGARSPPRRRRGASRRLCAQIGLCADRFVRREVCAQPWSGVGPAPRATRPRPRPRSLAQAARFRARARAPPRNRAASAAPARSRPRNGTLRRPPGAGRRPVRP